MQSDSSLFASVAYSPVHLYTHIGVFSWIPSLLNGLSFIMTIILLLHWPLTDTIRAFSGDFFTPLTSRNTLRLPLFVWYHAVLQSHLTPSLLWGRSLSQGGPAEILEGSIRRSTLRMLASCRAAGLLDLLSRRNRERTRARLPVPP